MRKIFTTYKSLTLSLLFIFLYSATVSLAAPLYNSTNTTLNPQCAPTDPDCRVSQLIAVENGGTGATTLSAARAGLGLQYADSSTISGEISQRKIAVWGDSLTQGAGGQGVSYPSVLSEELGVYIYNGGVGGEASTQIAVRQGGFTTTATISGGTIPSSGGVTVTFPIERIPITTQSPTQDIYGTIAGVYGRITRADGDVYTFTRSVAGDSVSVSSAPLIVDNSDRNAGGVIIWAGRNNYQEPEEVKSDIAAMVASLGHDRYLVLSILNGLDEPNTSGANYDAMMSLNADLAAIYGDHYLDVRSYLVSQYNPNNSQDVIDHNNDIPPSSLRYDAVHLNAAGYTKVAQYISQHSSMLFSADKNVITISDVKNLFGSVPSIGFNTPGKAIFSTLQVGRTSTDNLLDSVFFADTTSRKVGIGTSAPEKLFHLRGGDQQDARIRIQNLQGRKFDLVSGITNFSQAGFSIHDATADLTRFVITNTGNVGIGSVEPTSKLFIQSTDASVPGLTIKAASGQSASLFSLVNNAGDTILAMPNLLTTYGAVNTVVGVGAGVSINPIQYESQVYGTIVGGSANTIFGTNAGSNLIDGNENTLIGFSAGYGLIGADGGDPNFVGSLNTMVGSNAGGDLQTGVANVGVGQKALAGLTTGQRNVAIGKSSLSTITTQSWNVALGSESQKYATGSYNVTIGASAGAELQQNGNIAIGNLAAGDARYQGLYRTFIAGADTPGFSIDDVYFGQGKYSTAPTPYTIHGTDGYGTNVVGGDLQFSAGTGTGNASGGSIKFKLAQPTSSGSDFQYAYTKMILTPSGSLGVGTDTPSSALHLLSYAGRTSVRLQNGAGTSPGDFMISTSNNENAGGNKLLFEDGTGGTQYMALTNAGHLGIGTVSPEKSLHVSAPDQQNARIRIQNNQGRKFDLVAGVTNFSQVGFSIHDATADVTRLAIDNSGLVGIGTVTPSYTLSVGSSSVSGIVSSFQNSSGTCTINPTTTSLSCSSDRTLKKDITALDTSTLNKVLSLQPVTYHWNTESDTDSTHAGFIAQEVEAIFPDLVSTDPTTGLKSLAYTGLIPYTVKAIQDINITITTLADTTKTNSLRDSLVAWLGSAGNGIGELFSKKVHTDELCVGATCVTQEEFLQIVQQVRQQPVQQQTTITTPEQPANTTEEAPVSQEDTLTETPVEEVVEQVQPQETPAESTPAE